MNAPSVRGKPWPWIPWAVSVAGNVLLGVIGMFPFVFLVIIVRGALLNAFGWDTNAPELRDNTSLAAAIGVVGSVFVLILFVGFNRLVTRKSAVRKRPYWVVSSFLLLVPLILAAVWPQLWQ